MFVNVKGGVHFVQNVVELHYSQPAISYGQLLHDFVAESYRYPVLHEHFEDELSSKLPAVSQVTHTALPVQVRQPGMASMQFEHCSCELIYEPLLQAVQFEAEVHEVQLGIIVAHVTQTFGLRVNPALQTQMLLLSSMLAAASQTEQTVLDEQEVQPLIKVPQVKHMLFCRAYPDWQAVQVEAEVQEVQPVIAEAQVMQVPPLRA